MEHDQQPDELIHHWTILPDEWVLLQTKGQPTKLAFAALLKYVQRYGHFPRHPADVPPDAVGYLIHQLGVAPTTYAEIQWHTHIIKAYRTQIRDFLGVRKATVQDGEALVDWLSTHLVHPDPEAEAVKATAYNRLRALHLEPPTPDRMQRLIRSAVRRFETRLCATVHAHLSQETCLALDALIQLDGERDPDDTQLALFPMRSPLAVLKDDAGAVNVNTVLEEIAKLKHLRTLQLPPHLFHTVPTKLITHYRQRAASEPPRELRWHAPAVRVTLLAALCWQRQQEVTDNLVALLIHVAHRMGVRAEARVNDALFKHLKRVAGKTKLLYRLAKAATHQPDGVVKEVIYPAVGEKILHDLVTEAAADATYEHQIRLVTRNSYSHHYRRIVPALLDVLEFRSNNNTHRPVVEALAVLRAYRDRKAPTFPAKAVIPLDGVVKDEWQDLVLDEQQGGQVNRIAYELCVIQTLREKVRCKEVWVVEAGRFCNPDDDLPQDFEQRRDEYYTALQHPRAAHRFTDRVRSEMETALAALDTHLPTSSHVRILRSKQGTGRVHVTPLERQPEPPNLGKLAAALVRRWPMTNLLDILKETELRVHFTDAFKTVGAREVLAPDVLQRRLLLALHGLGTNAGLKRVCSGGTADTYADLLYVRRRYIHPEQVRAAIAKVCNAIFTVRDTAVWGAGTTACASDSKQFGAWDQNLMTEWHVRYGGPGIMVYWHVEAHSVCIYSQLKACSSSEVAAMIEGVLRHETAMEVDRQYVDTHGQSHVGFAFCFLLGFHLLPRLKNLKQQRLYRPNTGEPEKYAQLQPILSTGRLLRSNTRRINQICDGVTAWDSRC